MNSLKPPQAAPARLSNLYFLAFSLTQQNTFFTKHLFH